MKRFLVKLVKRLNCEITFDNYKTFPHKHEKIRVY